MNSEENTQKKEGSKSEDKKKEYHGPSEIDKKKHPLDRCNWWSFLFHGWVNQCIKISNKYPWQQEYHYELPATDRIQINEIKFEKAFEKTRSVLSAIFVAWGKDLALLFTVSFISVIMQLSVAMVIKIIIDDIQAHASSGKISSDQIYRYVTYFSIMILINLIVTICESRVTIQVPRISLRIRSSIVSLIMKKMLSYPVTNPNKFTEGKILNFVTIDANRFEQCAIFILWLCSSTLMIILATTGIAVLAGAVCIPVVVTLLFGTTFIYYMNKYWAGLKNEMMLFKDKRVNLLKNTITNIRFIKLRGLENFFHAKVFKKRNYEINNLIKQAWFTAAWIFSLWTFPSLGYIVLLLWILYLKPDMDISEIGPVVRFMMFLELACKILPYCLSYLVELQVSIRRLNEFLNSDSIDTKYIKPIEDNCDTDLEIKNGNFTWNLKEEEDEEDEATTKKKNIKKNKDKRSKKIKDNQPIKVDLNETQDLSENTDKIDLTSNKMNDSSLSILENDTDFDRISPEKNNLTDIQEPLLKPQNLIENPKEKKISFSLVDINLKINKGELIFIIGKVGSGKSSLLQALFGEMNNIGSDQSFINISDKISYLAQKPLMMSGTILENIILDSDFDQERLDWAIKYSALEDDLKIMEDK